MPQRVYYFKNGVERTKGTYKRVNNSTKKYVK